MHPETFEILDAKRHGRALSAEQISKVVSGAASGSWGDAELGAFLMAGAIRGFDPEETRHLTLEMLGSGEQWHLDREIPTVGDKHSTGGVGDKVSLVLAPLLAACDRPVVMLTGRGLGHTGGTADKLEAVPGVDLGMDRALCLRALRETGLAIGMATASIAPADRRLYALRDRTATISSLPLITASILSKKLATGAGALVFDVKTGAGAFLPEEERAAELAAMLVATAEAAGRRCRALVTDMSQPLGRWVGHAAEVREALDCLEGRGPEDLMEVTYLLSEELSELTGERLSRGDLEAAVASGEARERFDRWASLFGAERAWLAAPELPLAPEEVVLEAPEEGFLAEVRTRRLGEVLAGAGGGRLEPGGAIDFGVSLRVAARLGDRLERGQELARAYLRRRDPAREQAFTACFRLAETRREPPALLRRRL